MSDRKSTTLVFSDNDLLIHDKDQIALQEARNGLLQFDEVLRIAEEFSQAMPPTQHGQQEWWTSA